MPYLHFDEARRAAEQALVERLGGREAIRRALLTRDLFGKFRLALWFENRSTKDEIDSAVAAITRALAEQCGPWWSAEVLLPEREDAITRELYEETARHAQPSLTDPRLLILDRHRTRTAWFVDEDEPLWPARANEPPIIVFYSFKGGLGRSTCLASFAMQRARAGERVCVLDLDLDSPGVGRLLAADSEGLTAPWGVVDFLVEQSPVDAPLADYYHRCDRVAGAGELVVFPAGRVDEAYADKLARVDMEDPAPARQSGLGKLLARVRDELRPQWILLDARTGLSESAGRLLSGLAHLHVLLGTTQDQSWQGLNRVLDRLGKNRVERGQPQHELLIVHAMVPVGEAGRIARDAFLARAEQEFVNRYYAEEQADEEAASQLWTTADMEGQTAPHVPVPITYEARLGDFRDVAEIAELLCAGPYAELANRIVEKFEQEPDT